MAELPGELEPGLDLPAIDPAAEAAPVVDHAAEAAAAREAIERQVMARAKRRVAKVGAPASSLAEGPAVEEPPPDALPSDADDVLPSDREEIAAGDVDLAERARLNSQDSYYRGTLAGSARLTVMANLVTASEEGLSPEMKRSRTRMRAEYEQIVADLARYDAMRPWGTTLEAAAGLGGVLGGGIISPESFVGVAAKGATWLRRTVKAAFQQGMIQAATDPIVQWLNNEAGTQQGYDPLRTVTSAGVGAVIGGGLHFGGELISAARIRRLLADLAKEDSALAGELERKAATEVGPERLPSDEAPPTTQDAAAGPTEGAPGPTAGEQLPGEPGGRTEPPGETARAESRTLDMMQSGELTAERAAEMADEIRLRQEAAEDRILGSPEAGNEYRNAQRMYFSGDEATSRQGREKLDEIAGRLTPEQLRQLEEELPDEQTASWWRAVTDTLINHTSPTPELLGSNMADALDRLPNHSRWADMTQEQRLAVIAADKVMRDARELGVSTKEVFEQAIRATKRRFDDPADAEGMRGARAGGLGEGARPALAAEAAGRTAATETAPGRPPSDQAEPRPAAEGAPARPGSEIYRIDNAVDRDEPINVRVVRGGKQGERVAIIPEDAGNIIDVSKQLDGGMSIEEAIARSLGDHLDPHKPDLSKVRRVSEGAAAAAPAGTPRQPESGDALAAMPAAGAGTDEILELARRRGGGGQLPMEQQRAGQGTPTGTQVGPGQTGAGQAPPGTAIAPVPGAPSPAQSAAIKSLQQQAIEFAKAIGFPLRAGRVPIKNALGTTNLRTGVVRVREVPDFEVVAHEGGHAIEQLVGQDLTNLTQTFAAELAPLVSNPAAYPRRLWVKEGFAEYIRRTIGNPAHAQLVAPGFTAAFRNFMQARHPEILQAIDRAADAYQAYLRAPSVDVVGAVIRSTSENPTGWRGVVKDIRERGLAATIGTMLQHAYTGILDDKAPVARAVRELAQAIRELDPQHALVNLKAADNPEILLRLAGRSQQAAMHDMMDGTYGYHSTTPQGPSLTDALAKATGQPSRFGKWDEGKRATFSTYLVARRSEYLWRKFAAGELANPPAAFSHADAVTAIAELERANPTFREAGDMVHQYSRQQLQKALDAGLIDADLHAKLMGEEFYVPFMRDLRDKPLADGGAPARSGPEQKGPGMTGIVKRMQGSSRDIIDPIESMMMQTFLLNRTIWHNDVIRAFVRLADRAKHLGGHYVEQLPAHEMKKYTFDLGAAIERKALEKGVPPNDAKLLSASVANMFGEDPLMGSFFRSEITGNRGEPIVFYREGGELRAARFMSEQEGHALYETLTSLPKGLTDAWSELISTTSSLLRTGIISNPSFAVTNYIRDQLATAILRSDYIPLISGLRGIREEFAQGESARLYALGGGVAPGSSVAMVERAAQADINALAKKGYLVNRVSSIKGVLELASFTEAGTRNSVFAKVFAQKRAQGLSDYEAMIEAAFQATDVIDFSRHGSRTLLIRNYLPFLNAHFQGMDKAYRTMVQPVVDRIRGNQALASDPAELNNAILAWVKAGGAGMILGVAWAAINRDNEAYRDASPVIKGTHVVIPFGSKLFLVPKPFELGIGFTAGEYAFQRWAQDDPRAAGQFVTAAWQALEPPNPLGDIPALKAYFELKSNKSLFTGRDIVPDRMQRLPPAQQYTDRTSSLAKLLGGAINVSPMKIDHAIGSMFGNWGRDIMTLSSGVDESAPAANWEDRVFLRRLIKDPTRTSDVATRFWGFMARTTGTYNQAVEGYDNLVRLHDGSAAADFLASLAPRERAYVIMRSAADEDGKPAFNADLKRLHPLHRAYDAVKELNSLRRDLVDNNVTRWENNQALKLNPASRRDLIENVRELAQAEMRNAFVIMREPGYHNRALLDTAPMLEKIRAIAPPVADEIAVRYATAKVYPVKAVQAAYPEMERALLAEGSNADLAGMAADAKLDGYEFGYAGERVKRPKKTRAPIVPAPAAVP